MTNNKVPKICLRKNRESKKLQDLFWKGDSHILEEIKIMIREYYLQFYGNTFENVKGMGDFVAKYKLPKKEVESPTDQLLQKKLKRI